MRGSRESSIQSRVTERSGFVAREHRGNFILGHAEDDSDRTPRDSLFPRHADNRRFVSFFDLFPSVPRFSSVIFLFDRRAESVAKV